MAAVLNGLSNPLPFNLKGASSPSDSPPLSHSPALGSASSPSTSSAHLHHSTNSPTPSAQSSSSHLPRTGDINPLYSLGQRISTGRQSPVHLLASSNGELIIRSGTPPSKLYHPHLLPRSSTPPPPPPSSFFRPSLESASTNSSSRSSSSKGKATAQALDGTTGSLGPEVIDLPMKHTQLEESAVQDERDGDDDEEEEETEVVTGFKDKEEASSHRDELRFKLHEWKAEHHKDRRTPSNELEQIRATLDSPLPIPIPIPIATNGGRGEQPDDASGDDRSTELGHEDQRINGHSTPAVSVSASSYYSTASENLTAHSSESSFTSTNPNPAPTILSTSNDNDFSLAPPPPPPPPPLIPRPPTPQTYAEDDEHSETHDKTPVLPSSGFFVPVSQSHSRSQNVSSHSTSSNSSSSPSMASRPLATGAFIPPPRSSSISPSTSTSTSTSTSAASPRLSSSPNMRRSNTTVPVPSSPPPPSTRSRLPPIRTQSYHSHFQDPSSSSSHAAQSGLDEVESSIAAQAELIKKARIAKAKEQEQQRQAEEGMGAPLMKRRSTRMGSGSESGGNGVLVGNLIGTDHSAYVLMYNMLTGIRIGVSRCQAKLKRPLTDADYTARHKFSFDIVGNELTPSTKYDFKFKDYAPWVFRELREYFYLDPSDYLVSLTAKYILSELGSPGKSGSFFYFSRDYRFIIKTIRHSEHKFLRSILKEYHEYIKGNPHTLLSRFYGLHRVKLPRGKKIHFVIMNNLFPPHRDIHEKYDLKGSSVGRIYPEEKAKLNPESILKDLNWLKRGREIALGPEKKALFEAQLRRDTELMQRLGIMDYSLLTGIHNVHRGNLDNLRDGMLTVFQPDPVKTRRRKATQVMRDEDVSALRKAVQRSDPQALSEANKLPEHDLSERRLFLFYQDEGGIRATDENNEPLDAIYYLGIIDILTPYTLIKKLEHFFRGLKYDSHMISAVPPKEYGDRFMGFIYSIIRGNDASLRPRMWQPPETPAEREEREKGKMKAQ